MASVRCYCCGLSVLVLFDLILCITGSLPPFKALEFIREPQDVVVEVGGTARLSCSATYDGREPSVHSWERNGALLPLWSGQGQNTRYVLTDGSLYFDSIKNVGPLPDPGNYSCIPEVTEGSVVHRIASPSAQLQLAELSSFLTQPTDLSLQAGDTAMFVCKANARPAALYTWTRNGVLLSQSSGRMVIHERGEVLEIRQVTSDDVGQYRCRAENKAGKLTSDYASLTVDGQTATPMESRLMADQPRSPSLSTTTASSLLGGFFNIFGFGGDSKKVTTDAAPITFPIKTKFPPLTFNYDWITDFTTWLPTDSRAATSITITSTHPRTITTSDTSTTSTTTSTTVTVTDTPTTTSITSTIGSELTSAISPSLMDGGVAPDFVLKPWDTIAVAGSDVTLFCSVNGTDREGNNPTVSWLKGGSTIDTSAVDSQYSIVGSGSLQITNISQSDGGLYTCRGENLEDITDAEALLTIQVPPYFVTRPQNTYGRVNKDVLLNCDIRGNPQPRVYWLKDSDMVNPSEYFRIIGHSLKIMGLMTSDAGYFQCVGESSIGSVHAVAQLIVLDEDAPLTDDMSTPTGSPMPTVIPVDSSLPPVPSNLQAIITSQTYVTLSWTVVLSPGVAAVTTYTVTTLAAGDTQARVRSVNTSSTDYTVEGLLPGTNYIFQVTAYNRYGHSLRHAELTVTTQEEVDVPDTVRGFRAWATSHETIKVVWEPPSVISGGISEYRIYFYSEDQSQENFKVTNQLTSELNDLHPYTPYYVRVVARNNNGPGAPTEELIVRTFSAKPSAPPSGITVEPMSTTSVMIRWSPPPKEHQNGQLTGYKIRYKTKRSSSRATAYSTDADARSHEIVDLQPGATYQVRVAALNANGTGEFCPWTDVTTYTVELDESVPPGKPVDIQTRPFSREMIVSWVPPRGEVRIRGYKLGYGNTSPDEHWINNLSPGTVILTLTDLLPQRNYIVQILAYNNAGEGEPALQQTFTREDMQPAAHSELKPPLEVIVDVATATSVVVRWYDPTLGQNQRKQPDRLYTVKYNALSGPHQRKTMYQNTSDLFLNVDGLRPYTNYEFSVMVRKGDRASYYSLTARNTTYEAAPSDAPEDLTVTPIERQPNYLMVSWQPPSRPNGRIVTYTIYSTTNNESPLNSWIVETVEGHRLNHQFGPVTSSTVYYFRIAAHNKKGASPLSLTKVVKTLDAADLPPPPSGSLPISPDGFPNGQTPNDLSNEAKLSSVNDPTHENSQTAGPPPNTGLPSPQILWIIIAIVSTVTVIAIVLLVAVLCRKRILFQKNKPANLKASNQAPKGMSRACKQQPSDLWINQEQMELKVMDKPDSGLLEPDERTSMLHSQSQFDVASASLLGDGGLEEPRYSTLGRSRPIIIASQPHRDDRLRPLYDTIRHYSTMPRAAVQPMTVDQSRPLYPRTQFTSQAYGSTPRVHIGDTSQPMCSETSSFCTDPITGLNSLAYYPASQGSHLQLSNEDGVVIDNYMQPFLVNDPDDEVAPPRPPPMEGRHQLKSFTNAIPNGNSIPKHIVKPQPVSAYKPALPPPNYHELVNGGSLKRPPRPPYSNRVPEPINPEQEPLKMAMKNGVSAEQLNSEMAHLDTIMQDLHALNGDIECV